MNILTKIGYEITQGRKVEKPKNTELFIYWKDFLKAIQYQKEGSLLKRPNN